MEPEQSQEQFQVEEILDRGFNARQKRWYYLVKWRNYDNSQATWEPIDHLDNSRQIIQLFNSQYDQSMLGKYPHGIMPFWVPKKTNKLSRKQKLILKDKKQSQKKVITNKRHSLRNSAIQISSELQTPQKSMEIKHEVEQIYKQHQQFSQLKPNEGQKALQIQKMKLTQQDTPQINTFQQQLFPIRGQVIALRCRNKNNKDFLNLIKNQIFHNQLQFLVKYKDEDNNQFRQQWLSRLTTIKFFSAQLNLFYEKNIQFTNDQK